MRTIDDIDFTQLSSSRFEELCFDLLIELGFQILVWRQGGADSGRDIQGMREVRCNLLEPFEELWFFECKRYTDGVGPEVLNSKIAWADAQRPKHLVIFVSSYITNAARIWLENIGKDKFYRIHLIEGKYLQNLVYHSHSLVQRYFSTDMQKLMQDTQRAWLVHNLIPEPWLIRTLADTDALLDYTPAQLAFLWSAIKIQFLKLNENMDDSSGESYDILFRMLRQHANTSESVLAGLPDLSIIQEEEGVASWDVVYPKIYAAQIAHLVDRIEYIALYSFVRDSEGEGIEVLVDQNSSFEHRIRHIPTGAKDALAKAKSLLWAGYLSRDTSAADSDGIS